MLESAVEQFIDYRTMMDELLPALWRPKDNWRKFTKIVQFLMATRRYVADKQAFCVDAADGYYHDVKRLLELGELRISTIGTSNYSSFCRRVLGDVYAGQVHHLNGSLEEYFDPYKGEIVGEEDVPSIPRFVVPFMFTQSGIKPLTSVEVSRRYVDFYDQAVESDAVVLVGFGINKDDGHINGLLRHAVDKGRRRIVVVNYGMGECATVDALKDEICERLRIDEVQRVEVLVVSQDRTVQGQPWHAAVLESLSPR